MPPLLAPVQARAHARSARKNDADVGEEANTLFCEVVADVIPEACSLYVEIITSEAGVRATGDIPRAACSPSGQPRAGLRCGRSTYAPRRRRRREGLDAATESLPCARVARAVRVSAHKRSSDAVVAVASLGGDRRQTGLDHLAEMTACGCRGHPRLHGESMGSEGSAVTESERHAAPTAVGENAADRCDFDIATPQRLRPARG